MNGSTFNNCNSKSVRSFKHLRKTADDSILLHHSEDTFIVWLDANINRSDDCIDTEIELRQRFKIELRTFTDLDPCANYLRSDTSDQNRVFVIVSGSFGFDLLSQVCGLNCIMCSYIFCGNEALHTDWANKFVKIKGVFSDKKALFNRLSTDLLPYLVHQTPIHIFLAEKKQQSIHDLNGQTASFMWFNLILRIILLLQDNRDYQAKKDLLEICRELYADDPIEEKRITHFENTYIPGQGEAIHWYTGDNFLYRALNRAFRTNDIDIIFRFRYIIAELHEQLASLPRPTTSEPIYRGQLISTKELEILQKKNKDGNGIISMHTFLSTTTSFQQASGFAQIGMGDIPECLKSVVFAITVEDTRLPFAHIDNFSTNPNEKEILFSVGAVFRIDNIEEFDCGYMVYLTLTTEIEQQFDALLKCYTKEIGQSPQLYQLASFLARKGDSLLAERYSQRILNDRNSISHENMRIICFANLASIYLNRSDHTQAMEYVESILVILKQNNIDQNTALFAECYAGISQILSGLGQPNEALEYSQRALSIALIVHPQDKDLIALIYNQLGDIYRALRDYSMALDSYTLSLKYDINMARHVDLSNIYYNIGYLYIDLNQYETARVYFQEAQVIQKASLPPEHPAHSLCERGLAIAYLKSGDYHQALLMSQHSLDCALHEVPLDFYSVGTGYRELGRIFMTMGDYTQAESLYRKALQFYRKKSTNHINIANVHHLLGNVYQDMNKREDARNNYKCALDIYREQNTPDLWAIADVLFNLGNIEINGKKAIQYYKQTLSTLLSSKNQKLFRADLALTYIGLGNAYVNAKRKDNALSAFHTAETIGGDLAQQKVIDRQLSIIFNNLGTAFASIKDFNKGLECMHRALEIDLQTYHSLHPEIGLRFGNLGSMYSDAEDYERAFAFYEKAVNVFSQDKSKSQLSLAQTYREMSLTHHELDNFDASLEYRIKELKLRSRCSGPNDLDLAECYGDIGTLYDERNDFATAITCYLTELHIQQANMLPFDPELAETSETVAEHYSRINQHNSAIKYFIKAREIKQKRKLPLAWIYKQLADEYEQLKKLNKALIYYRLSIKHLISENKSTKTKDYYDDLSSLYYDIAYTQWHLKQLRKAIDSLKLSRTIQKDFLQHEDYDYLRVSTDKLLNRIKKKWKNKPKGKGKKSN